jgi:hypothetical protein
MKKLLWILLAGVLFVACEKDEETTPEVKEETQPTELTLLEDWVEYSIAQGEEQWYRVSLEETHAMAIVEWAEASGHGSKYNFDGDVVVSAYQLNGTDAYFQDKDNGYDTGAKTIELANNEKQFLLKVVGDSTGSFAIRVKGKALSNIEYTAVDAKYEWITRNIDKDQIIGYEVKCKDIDTVAVIWKVEGTAQVAGSVFQMDGETVYEQFDNDGKTFLDKSNSSLDKPKGVLRIESENKIKVQIRGVEAGEFSVMFVDWNELNKK